MINLNLKTRHAWAVIDRMNNIAHFNGHLAIFDSKFDAEYERFSCSEECVDMRVIKVKIAEVQ